MGLLKNLFSKQSKTLEDQTKRADIPKDNQLWKALPAYVPADETDYEEVSLIATAISAGNSPKSSFKINQILQKNSEFQCVALIATSIAAANNPTSQFQVQSIKVKIN